MKNEKAKTYIFICTAKDCKKRGSKDLTKSWDKLIKRHGLRGSTGIIKTKCMNHCKNGPNVIINNCIHHQVKENDFDDLIDD